MGCGSTRGRQYGEIVEIDAKSETANTNATAPEEIEETRAEKQAKGRECDVPLLGGETEVDWVEELYKEARAAEQPKDRECGSPSKGGVRKPPMAVSSHLKLSTAAQVSFLQFCVENQLEVDGGIAELLEGASACVSANVPGEPIVWVNDEFVDSLGWSRQEVLGQPCKFLQGEKTTRESRAEVRRLLESKTEGFVSLVNYTKQGKEFDNALYICPLYSKGECRFFLGSQLDIRGLVRFCKRVSFCEEIEVHPVEARKQSECPPATLTGTAPIPGTIEPPSGDVQAVLAAFDTLAPADKFSMICEALRKMEGSLTGEVSEQIQQSVSWLTGAPDGGPNVLLNGSPVEADMETAEDAQERIKRRPSMHVPPARALDEARSASKGGRPPSRQDAENNEENKTDHEGGDLHRKVSKRAVKNSFLFDVNPTVEAPKQAACEKCACGELSKSKDLEDILPQYDEFVYQPVFESVTPVQIPWVAVPELKLGVSTTELKGPGGASKKVTIVEDWVFRKLAERCISDVEHYLRPGHLQQLANILSDPEASDNDKFTAQNLLQNATIAAKGVLPGCQDTGTAICLGKKGQFVWTSEEDEKHLSHGIFDAYTKRNLRYSQVAPVSMFAEKNTKCNLPAQFDLYSVPGNEYKFMFMAKGGGSANKTYLYQQTKALLNPKALEAFIKEKVITLGTSACPPYHLAIVIGGLSAEGCLKTVKLASARYLDDLPQSGNDNGRAFRDVKWEDKIRTMCQGLGIGAQFGGKYFVHDVRIIRMPRHGASCPVGIGVSCSADRQILAKITDKGVFIEQLETNPGRFLQGTGDPTAGLGSAAVTINLNQPMKEILATLTNYPVKTRLSLSGTIIVARDIAHAKLAERLETEGSLPDYMGCHVVYYAGPAKTPEGYASGSFGPTTAGRMDTYVPIFQKQGYSMITLAKGNRAKGVTESCKKYGGFYLGSIGGAAANLAEHSIKKVEVVEYEELGMEAVWCIEVEDFPAFMIVDDKGNDFFSDWKM